MMMMIRLRQFTGGGNSTVKGGRRESKVREAGEQCTGGGRFWPPCPPHAKSKQINLAHWNSDGLNSRFEDLRFVFNRNANV